MAVRVAINGFGRIGRNIVRAIYESGRKDIDVVAVNDLGPVETNAHLLRYDSVHGRFPHEVKVDGDTITIGKEKFKVTAVKDPVAASVEGSRRRHRARMHRHLHRPRQGRRASDRRRQARHRLGPGRRRRPHRRLRHQPRQADQGPHRHLERLLHHQLPGADGDGDERARRHRKGHDDDDPLLHRRPADARHHAQGPLPRPRRSAVADPDLDRCGQGHRPRACPSSRASSTASRSACRPRTSRWST